jgi:hypothetical protein
LGIITEEIVRSGTTAEEISSSGRIIEEIDISGKFEDEIWFLTISGGPKTSPERINPPM